MAWTVLYLVSASLKAQLGGLRSDPGRPCPAGLGAGPEELVTVMYQKENPLLGWAHTAAPGGLAPTLTACPGSCAIQGSSYLAPLCPPPPCRPKGSTPDSIRKQLFHLFGEFTAHLCFYCYSHLFQTPPLRSGDFSAASDIHVKGQSFLKVTTEILNSF